MKLLITLIVSLSLANSLFAINSIERSKLLAQVKASKKSERKSLSKRIAHFKQSKKIHPNAIAKAKKNTKFKKRLRRKHRLRKSRPKRTP